MEPRQNPRIQKEESGDSMSAMPEHDPNHLESSGAPDEQRSISEAQDASESHHDEIVTSDHLPVPIPDPALDPVVDPVLDPVPDRISDPWFTPPAPGPHQPPAWNAHRPFDSQFDSSYSGPTFALLPQVSAYRPVRIPHLGHLLLLLLFFLFGWAAVGLLTLAVLRYHLLGIFTLDDARNSVQYLLGSEAVLYLVTFGISLATFPLIWHKNFFAGVQWNGAAALRRYRVLLSAAFACFLLALLNGYLMPGPTNAPIDKIFEVPGAAWLMFAFGVTFAPFFEEMFFRGFLLPALSTSFDWIGERIHNVPPRPLDENGHPQWSFGAMVFAAVTTSIPFALLHAAQTGYSLGPFVLLVFVSLVLCWARLSTRSLAASVMIHASYNFMLFTLMMLGTGGFRHMSGM
jgi:CAAX protease family protein